MAKAITDKQIEQLQIEAAEAGDLECCELCLSALEGNLDARDDCQLYIDDAAAMDND